MSLDNICEFYMHENLHIANEMKKQGKRISLSELKHVNKDKFFSKF